MGPSDNAGQNKYTFFGPAPDILCCRVKALVLLDYVNTGSDNRTEKEAERLSEPMPQKDYWCLAFVSLVRFKTCCTREGFAPRCHRLAAEGPAASLWKGAAGWHRSPPAPGMLCARHFAPCDRQVCAKLQRFVNLPRSGFEKLYKIRQLCLETSLQSPLPQNANNRSREHSQKSLVSKHTRQFFFNFSLEPGFNRPASTTVYRRHWRPCAALHAAQLATVNRNSDRPVWAQACLGPGSVWAECLLEPGLFGPGQAMENRARGVSFLILPVWDGFPRGPL